MPFNNPVMGGKYLVRTVMQSDNFSMADQTGWAVFQNGDAWFFNVTAAGAVTANTVIIAGNGDGTFIYSGLPAYGSLILAMASQAGTDAWGNEYSGPGISLSQPGTGGSKNNIQIRPDYSAVLIYE